MLTELTNQNYNEVFSTEKPLVVEFYSPTCTHCKRTEAGLNEVAEEQGENVVIAKCDITANPALAQQYDVAFASAAYTLVANDAHPTACGHKYLARQILKALEK